MIDIENIVATRKPTALEWQSLCGHDHVHTSLAGDRPAVMHRGDSHVRIEEIDNFAALHRHRYAWRGLAAFAVCANPGHESFLIEPVLRHLQDDLNNLKFILIWLEKPDDDTSKLIGFFAIQRQTWRWGVPFRFAKSWSHFFTFLGTPLIHKLHAPAALDGFFTWARDHGKLNSFLFSGINGEGRYFEALRSYLKDTGKRYQLFDRHDRACLKTSLSVQDYLCQSLPRKRRKEYRRLRTRLSEQGDVVSSFTDQADGIDVWIEDFLTLEAKGWKGQAGTAFLSRQDWASSLREALSQAFQDGRGLFWKLTLDGKLIAMSFGFKAGRRAWLAKIAYDENLSRFSPGVLLIFDVMETYAARDDIDVIDSCAMPDHPMINHIWRERLTITDMLVDVGAASSLHFHVACKLEEFRRQGRAALKKGYHFIKNKGWLS